MSIGELNDATKCDIGPAAAYLGMCVRILWRARLFIMTDPIAYPWNHHILVLMEPLLKIAERERERKTGHTDGKFLSKLLQEIDRLEEGAEGEFSRKLNQVLAAIKSHLPK
jgi:hypothetical protein